MGWNDHGQTDRQPNNGKQRTLQPLSDSWQSLPLDADVARTIVEAMNAEPVPPDFDTVPDPVECAECGEPVLPVWVGRVSQGKSPFWHSDNLHDACRSVRGLREELARVHAERKAHLVEKLREDAGIDIGVFGKMRFDTYEPETEMQQRALAAARRIAGLITKQGEPEFIQGIWLWSKLNGIGKTHLSVAIVDAALNAGWTAYILVEPALVKDMRDGFGATNKESEFLRQQASEANARAQQTIERAKTVDLLLLDDLGRGHVSTNTGSQWLQNDVMFPILDARYHRQLSTIVTSNFPPDQIMTRLGTANADRLEGLCPFSFEMDGESHRRR